MMLQTWSPLHNGKALVLLLTRHATARCRQRGIRTGVLEFVAANFDCDHDAGDGKAAISISRRRLAELQARGVLPKLIDQASHTVLIMGEGGAIVTAINRPTWFSRFHHGAERLGHRHRVRRRRAVKS